MKSSNTILMLCILATFSLVASCKKDNKNIPTTTTKTQYLTKGPWKMTGYKINLNGTNEYDYYATFKPCVLDNTETYFQDFTFVFDRGPVKCNVADSQLVTSKWAFNETETAIIFIYGVDSSTQEIRTLNNDILELHFSTTDSLGITNYELAYSH